jgi:hypothetical protein
MRKRTVIGAMVCATIVFFAIIGFGVHSSADDDTKDLQLLHVILRHGARTPATTYPKDPYVTETFYPVGWGQLTNVRKNNLWTNLPEFFLSTVVILTLITVRADRRLNTKNWW